MRHASNPRPKRRRHSVAGHFMRSASARGREVWVPRHMSNPYHRRRRNPRSLIPAGLGGVKSDLMAAAVGVAGALAIEYAWSKLGSKLPTTLQSGYGAVAGQAAIALGVGYAAAKFMPRNRRMVASGTVGALVVIGWNAVKPLVAAKLGLSGLQDFRAYMVPAGAPAGLLPAPAGIGRVAAYLPRPGVTEIQNPAVALRGVMAAGVGGLAPSF